MTKILDLLDKLTYRPVDPNYLHSWLKENLEFEDDYIKNTDVLDQLTKSKFCFLKVNDKILKKLNIGSLVFSKKSNVCFMKTGEDQIKIIFKNGNPIILNMNALRESKLVRDLILQLKDGLIFRTMNDGDGIFYMKTGSRLKYTFIDIHNDLSLEISNTVKVDLK